jgi:hypothetical protein
MFLQKTLYFLVASLPLFFYSCVPQKKAVSHQQEIAKLDSVLQNHSRALKDQDAVRKK